MSTEPVFDYTKLDETSTRVVEVMAAIWAMKVTMPKGQWLDLFISTLTNLLVQAEALGRAWGRIVPSVDGDPAMPPIPTTPYRPIPDDFSPKVSTAPTPKPVIDEARVKEVRGQIAKAVTTLVERYDEAEQSSSPAGVPQAPKVSPVAKVSPVSKPTEATPAPRLKSKPVRDSGARHTGDDIVTTDPVLPDDVERMVKDEAVSQVQRGVQNGARLTRRHTGYRRGVNPDCCELCFWLWKEGHVYPINQPMHRHTGCRCWPIFTNDIEQDKNIKDEDGQRLMDRYTSNTLRETTYRKNKAN